jgi:GT2 family glycosyltransferase
MAAIVINWNHTAESIDCLGSVIAAGWSNLIPILVDSGSDQDPEPALEAALPGVEVLHLPNRGYAAACNAGARRALERGAVYLLFMNNDASVEPGALSVLADAASEHPFTILGPKIVYADRPEVVWSAGGRLRGAAMKSEHIGEGEPAATYSRPIQVQWTTGCAILVTAATYRLLGPMDEGYFLYLEDTDWCLRATRLGLETWIVPQAVIRHQVSTSVSAISPTRHHYYAYRNHYRLAFRHGSPPIRLLVAADVAWTFIKVGIRCVLSASYRRDSEYHGRTWALLDFLLGRSGPGFEIARPASELSGQALGPAAEARR